MRRALPTVAVVITIILWIALCVRLAWLAEDAFFTLRMAENLGTGHGLVWNPGSRVMVASCPLWVLTLAGGMAIVDKPYSVTIAISVLLSAGMATLLARKVAAAPLVAVVALVVLGASRAVTDWAVSGMENPLIFLLLVAAVAAWRAERATWLGAAAGLLVVVRLDLALLISPLVLVGAIRGRRWSPLVAFVAPVTAWLAFSIVWFGVPFPNPVYAKIQTAIPLDERLHAASNYLLESWRADPVTPTVLALGPLIALALRVRGAVPLILGLLAYGGAAAWVGSDYMLGRLLGGPLVFVVSLLATARPRVSPRVAGVLATALVAVVVGVGARSYWLASLVHHEQGEDPFGETGVVDVRAYYVERTGLWSTERRPGLDRELTRHGPTEPVAVVTGAGFMAFSLGPEVTVVDLWGIGDPLLARMPPLKTRWHVGHFRRAMPTGYLESLRDGTNEITDPAVAHLWDLLLQVHSAPLWTAARWRAILELNTTDTRPLTAAWEDPLPTLVTMDELPARFGLSGLRVRLGGTVNAHRLRIVAPDGYNWQVILRKNGRRLGPRLAIHGDREATSTSAHELVIGDRFARQGFDELKITGPWRSDQDFRIESIELIDTPR